MSVRSLVRQVTIAALLLLGACVDSSVPETSSVTPTVVSGVGRCVTDCDCGFGAVCGGDTCQPDFGPFPECYCSARDCSPGETCSGGFCVATTPTCTTDCDCGFGAVCGGGLCQPDFGPYPECYCAARDCAPGETCSGGFCRDRRGTGRR